MVIQLFFNIKNNIENICCPFVKQKKVMQESKLRGEEKVKWSYINCSELLGESVYMWQVIRNYNFFFYLSKSCSAINVIENGSFRFYRRWINSSRVYYCKNVELLLYILCTHNLAKMVNKCNLCFILFTRKENRFFYDHSLLCLSEKQSVPCSPVYGGFCFCWTIMCFWQKTLMKKKGMELESRSPNLSCQMQ